MFVTLLTFADIRILIEFKKKYLTTDNINLYDHYRFLVIDVGYETRAEAEETLDKLKLAMRHD
jgi:hypothetical protein